MSKQYIDKVVSWIFTFDNKIKLENRQYDLLTIGELLIDMISENYDDMFEGKTYNKFFGGSPANIAMNTKKLGISANIVAAVGKDGFGDFLIKQLKASKIDTGCIQKVDSSTSLVIVTKSKNSPIPIFYRGADYHLSYNPKLEEMIKNSKIVHFSSWPLSRQPARDTIERAIKEARKNNNIICFDPNYHPMLWKSDKDGVEYIKALIAQVDIIKPSEDDAERIFGKDSSEKQVAKFLKLGAKLVIMTMGSQGAVVSNGVETIKFDTLASEIVDTTGAGDAFWSGFYAAIVKGYTIREALNFGFAVSAYKLRYVGAVVELPKLEVIKKVYNL
ncbi:carbohydrate kinase family protein [Clostridium thermarum]|uniref:carbohydrate kinase family protein n=1 Tax=Clostridium thermarum TaxID=1716543 RepID=UPI001FAA9CE3|nr:carbohydrate kinase [Clostridium thermarum]